MMSLLRVAVTLLLVCVMVELSLQGDPCANKSGWLLLKCCLQNPVSPSCHTSDG